MIYIECNDSVYMFDECLSSREYFPPPSFLTVMPATRNYGEQRKGK